MCMWFAVFVQVWYWFVAEAFFKLIAGFPSFKCNILHAFIKFNLLISNQTSSLLRSLCILSSESTISQMKCLHILLWSTIDLNKSPFQGLFYWDSGRGPSMKSLHGQLFASLPQQCFKHMYRHFMYVGNKMKRKNFKIPKLTFLLFHNTLEEFLYLNFYLYIHKWMCAPNIYLPTHCLFRFLNVSDIKQSFSSAFWFWFFCLMGLLHINNIFSYGLFPSPCNYLFRLMSTRN